MEEKKVINLGIIGDWCPQSKTHFIVAFGTKNSTKNQTISNESTVQNYDICYVFEAQAYNVVLYNTNSFDRAVAERQAMYPNTDVFMIIFSLMKPDTFESAKNKWIPEMKSICPKTPFVVVGGSKYERDHYYEMKDVLDEEGFKPVFTEEAESEFRQLGASSYIEADTDYFINIFKAFESVIIVYKDIIIPERAKKKQSTLTSPILLDATKNGINYRISGTKAFILESPDAPKEVLIPAKFTKVIVKFPIIKIVANAFANSNIESIQLKKKSKIKIIETNCFPKSLERLEIPSLKIQMQQGWSNNLKDGMKVSCQEEKIVVVLHNDLLFSSDHQKLLFVPEGKKSIIIPIEVKSISHFFDSLEVKTKNSITQIEIRSKHILDEINSFTFRDMNIETLILPEDYDSFNFHHFNQILTLKNIEMNKSIKTIDNSKNFDYSVFDGAIYTPKYEKLIFVPKGKIRLNLHSDTIEIGDSAASETRLVEINFDNNRSKLNVIGADSFSSSLIASFEANSNVTVVKKNAFYCCKNLRYVSFSFSKEITFENQIFLNSNELSQVIVGNDTVVKKKENVVNAKLRIVKQSDYTLMARRNSVKRNVMPKNSKTFSCYFPSDLTSSLKNEAPKLNVMPPCPVPQRNQPMPSTPVISNEHTKLSPRRQRTNVKTAKVLDTDVKNSDYEYVYDEEEEEEEEQSEKQQKQKLEKQKLEKQKLEKQKLEKQKLEKQKLENQKLENQKLENQKLEKEKLSKENLEKTKIEIPKIVIEKNPKGQLEKEKQQKQKLEKEDEQNYEYEEEEEEEEEVEVEEVVFISKKTGKVVSKKNQGKAVCNKIPEQRTKVVEIEIPRKSPNIANINVNIQNSECVKNVMPKVPSVSTFDATFCNNEILSNSNNNVYGNDDDNDDSIVNFKPFGVIGQDRINEFEENEAIGSGATAKVTKVYNKVTKSFYARKTLFNGNAENVKQLIKEINILQEINHPSIMKLYGFSFAIGNLNPSLYLELLSSSLKNEVLKGTISNTILTRIIVEICFGLNHMLRYNLLHRDLKPENIMLTKNKHARICDFGISSVFEDSRTITTGIGTIVYMSPEMAREEKYTYKTDVYSLGITMYFIAFGEIPKMSIIDKANGVDIKMPSKLAAKAGTRAEKVTDFFRKAINQCCSQLDDERPSYRELLDVMEKNDFKLFEDVNPSDVKKRFDVLDKYEKDFKF